MFLFIAVAALLTFVIAMGAVMLISLDRAASLADHPSLDLVLPRK